jgi:mRNA-degrading endonuclease HigB of HigAB toxin-antitoxin module
LYCFNIKGNNFRMAAIVTFKDGQVYIEKVITHAEYDKWNKTR